MSETYLKDIENYELKIYFDKQSDNVVCVKKIKKIIKPFVLNEDGYEIIILDKGYFIVEIVPLAENYIARIHLDENGNVIERFFTMTKKNKFKDGVPAYDDLMLSYVCSNFTKKVYNKDRFELCFRNKEISRNVYDDILKKFDDLKHSIDCGKNDIYNIDYKKYLG